MGYVTTGHYSLSRGHGFAIGAVALKHLLSLEEQSIRWVLMIHHFFVLHFKCPADYIQININHLKHCRCLLEYGTQIVTNVG